MQVCEGINYDLDTCIYHVVIETSRLKGINMTLKTRILYEIANVIDGMPSRYFDTLSRWFSVIMRRDFNSMLRPRIGS